MTRARKRTIWDTDDNFRQEGIVIAISPDHPRGAVYVGRAESATAAAVERGDRSLHGPAPSTIGRELERNAAHHDGAYRPSKAQERTNGRRSRTRRWSKLTAKQWMFVEDLLEEGLSPDQISGRLRLDGTLRISHEAIYQYVWADKRAVGELKPTATLDLAAQRARNQAPCAQQWPRSPRRRQSPPWHRHR
jgi:IS30 family transposase